MNGYTFAKERSQRFKDLQARKRNQDRAAELTTEECAQFRALLREGKQPHPFWAKNRRRFH